MAKNIGNIYAELSVRDKMTVGLKRAEKSLLKFGKTGLQAGAAASAALAAGMAVGSKRALDLVDSLGDLSIQSGLAVSQMAILQRAYKDGGSDAARAGKDIARMQKTLAEASTGGKDPFSKLGLSVSNLMGMSPAQQMEKIGQAILSIQNPAERTAAAMEIFGKSGSKLLSVFGTIESARESLGRMPVLAQLFAKEMGQANDIIGHIPGKMEAFFVGFTSGIMNDLLPALKKIDEFDFATIGQNAGRFVMDFVSESKSAFETLTKYNPMFHLAVGALDEYINGNLKEAQSNQLVGGVDLDKRQAERIATDAQKAPKEGWLGFKPTQEQLDKHAEFLKKKNAEDEKMREESKRLYDAEKQEMDDHQREKLEADNERGNELARAIFDRQSQEVDDWGGGSKPIEARVNEMQARGLGMGAMDVPMKVDKQINLLEQIRDEIKKKQKAEGATF